MHRFAACLWSAGALLAQTNPTEVPPIQSVWSLTPPLPLPPSTVSTPAERVAPRADVVPPAGWDGAGFVEPLLKSVTRPHGTMPHQLVGIGVITGLSGGGSSDRGTRQAILNFVRDHSLNLAIDQIGGGNTALVSLTALLPPFAKQGDELTVNVQVIGDATSLRGGTLLRAELHGVDGQTHVVAQGQVNVGGYAVQGANASAQKNSATNGKIANGGIVIRDYASSYYSESGALELKVTKPSAFNATSIAAAIRTALQPDGYRVTPIDCGLVRIEIPAEQRSNENALLILSRIGELKVRIENQAKVVIDQNSGVILAGEGVHISPCVVGLTDMTIAIVNEDEIVQPNPFGNGDTARAGRTHIEVQTTSSELKPLSGAATVGDLLQNLRSLGLTPLQLMSVFRALDEGGYLHARLEVL